MLALSQFTVLAVFVYADIATLAFNSNTERAKAGVSSRVQGQPSLVVSSRPAKVGESGPPFTGPGITCPLVGIVTGKPHPSGENSTPHLGKMTPPLTRESQWS